MANKTRVAPPKVVAPKPGQRPAVKPGKALPTLRRDLAAILDAADSHVSTRRLVGHLFRYLPGSLLDAVDPKYDPAGEGPGAEG